MAPTPKKTPLKTPKRTPAAKAVAAAKPELRRSARKTPLRSCSKTNLKSTEDQVVETMRKYAFKASPLNRKILAPGCMAGIPVVTRPKKATVVKPFSFATEDRLAVRKKVSEVKAGKSTSTERENVNQKPKTGGARVVKPVRRPPPLRSTTLVRQ